MENTALPVFGCEHSLANVQMFTHDYELRFCSQDDVSRDYVG